MTVQSSPLVRIGPLFSLVAFILVVATAPKLAFSAESNLGRSQQPLVSPNPPVSAFDRERLGLIYLYNAQNHTECSGSLLTNLWVLTAAHCVEDLNGGQIGVPGVISVRGDWSTTQQKKGAEIVNFRPVDIAIVRLESPMRVFGSERRFHADLWRSQDSNLNGREIRVFGMGLNGFAVDKNTPSSSDETYRWFDVTIKSDVGRAYSYTATPTQSVLGGDSGGPSYVVTGVASQKVAGVHSLDIGVNCVGNLKPCDWDFIKSVAETQDARVSLVADQIDAAIARSAPPQWSDMGVESNPDNITYIKPTVHIGNDNYRADVCLTWAKDCGQRAAEAFCRSNDSGFTGGVIFDTEPFGHTGIAGTGETCFGSGCQAFKKIVCLNKRFTDAQIKAKSGTIASAAETSSSREATETSDSRLTNENSFSRIPNAATQKLTAGSGPLREGGRTLPQYLNSSGPVIGEPGGFAGPAPTMTGTFDTDFGVLALTANDGAYTVKNGRVKILKIVGDFMDGTWTQSASDRQCADGTFRGTFHFHFIGHGFSGTYGYCDGPTNAGAWNGTRR